MEVQWYPGHMARARRELTRLLPLADVIMELADARIPESSRNPDLQGLLGGRPRVVILAKADLAEQKATEIWTTYLRKEAAGALAADLRQQSWLASVRCRLARVAGWRRKRRGGPVRVLTVGIPNVGKSTAINRLAGGGRARVGALPGVTRGPQWIRAGPGLLLLDTPGLLWPKLDEPRTGLHLVLTGAIRDEVYDVEEAGHRLLDLIIRRDDRVLRQRYGAPAAGEDAAAWLLAAGRRRGAVGPGGSVDVRKAAEFVLRDFRSGKLGRWTLESPPDGGGGSARPNPSRP